MHVLQQNVTMMAGKHAATWGVNQDGSIISRVLSKIELGQKAINAMELQGVCDALGLDVDALIAEKPRSLALAFMGNAKTDSAQQAIECVDRLAEEYLWQLKIARGESPC